MKKLIFLSSLVLSTYIIQAQPLDTPSVTCAETTTNSLAFDWNDIENAVGYEASVELNGNVLFDTILTTSYLTVFDLFPGTEVTVNVIAIANIPSNNSSPTSSICVTADCPQNPITINNIGSEYCQYDAPIELSASPVGTVFTGDGVIDNVFYPNLVEGSESVLQAEYNDTFGCLYANYITVIIVESLASPIIACHAATTNSVSFAWAIIEGAMSYEITVFINDIYAYTENTQLTSHEITGLTVNDEVTLEVTAVSTGICGNSEIGSSTCLPVGINDLTQKPTVHISTLINQQQPFLINGKDIFSTTLTIYDLQGRAIYQKNGQTTYPLDLPNGLYIYELKLNDQQETSESIRGKFIVQ